MTTTKDKQTTLQPVPKQGEITKPRDAIETIGQVLSKKRTDLQKAAGKGFDVDRLLRLTINSIRKTPDLATCDPVSIIASVMQCAQLRLDPDSVLGHVYLVPFNNRQKKRRECQVIIGYKGMIELSLRSGFVETVEGYPVYEGDEFEYALGLNRKLNHKPSGEEDPKKLTHAYGIVRFKDGGVLFSVLTRRAIDAIRAASPGKDQKPWVEHYPDMAVKSAIRRIWKFAPKSTELARAANLEERAEAGISIIDDTDIDFGGGDVVIDAREEEPKSKLDDIADKHQKKAGESPMKLWPSHRDDCAMNQGGKECDLGCEEPEPPIPGDEQ